MSARWIIRGIVIASIVAVAAMLLHFLLFTRTGIRLTHTNVHQVSSYLQSLGGWSYVLGMGAILLQTSFLPVVPFVVLAGANVLAFGLVKGFLINYITACLGSSIAFWFARSIGHDWVERKLAQHPLTQAFNRRLETHGWAYVLLGRLIPIIPSSAINFGAGATKTKYGQFLLGTALGKLPIVLMESLIGFDLMHIRQNRGRLIVLLIIFILLMLVGSWLKKKLANKNAN